MKLISDGALAMHRERLRTLKLRYSVFEKSYRSLCGCTDDRIRHQKGIPPSELEELLHLKGDILAHELYFSCFFSGNPLCITVPHSAPSPAELKYRIFCNALSGEGFFILFADGRGRMDFYSGNSPFPIFERYKALLAIDLCEHAYFYDYGFDKESYLRSALNLINFSKNEK